ncbi:uncharacterized protein BBA_07797 [Beauveria bassiana ARSEF 2860]|uniref:Uncharacterized protein n=1 Tax=Beauveria bassiana (strain ARSEF 2860) TaxID=655819 RepID=J4UIA3_BEAB2|nr:uncharacterized protein BBA_07797 [Beauveria bassiana ARSEF 2860]EJP63197.1 hypothetical protein BBA_07797 [Beauveria bassiana ARSEF 2860]
MDTSTQPQISLQGQGPSGGVVNRRRQPSCLRAFVFMDCKLCLYPSKLRFKHDSGFSGTQSATFCVAASITLMLELVTVMRT